MRNNYLIPANMKSGQLILNMFKPFDLGLAIAGAFEILIALMITSNANVTEWYYQLLAVLPGLILFVLVIRIPYYHNVRTLINDIYLFYSTQRSFRWRGWYKDVTK